MKVLSVLKSTPTIREIGRQNRVNVHDHIGPDKRARFAILGGHGNEHSVSTLFYPGPLGGFQQGFPYLSFIAVDPIVNRNGGQERIIAQKRFFHGTGFSYDDSISPETFYRQLESGQLEVDGVVLAIPVKYHLPETEKLLRIFDKLGIKKTIMVEKPLGLIGEEKKFRELNHSHSNQIFAADFSNGTDSLNFSIYEGYLSKIGNITAICGRFVESQSIDELVAAAEARNLFRLDINGGGMAFDMGVHSLVTEERILQERGLTLQGSNIREVFLGAFDHSELEKHRDKKAETYWRTHLTLSNGTDVYNDAGKVMDDHCYIVQVSGEKGQLVLSSGTQNQRPFVLYVPNDGIPELFKFPEGVGYESIFANFLVCALGNPDDCSPTVDMCMNAASTSVETVGRSYEHAFANDYKSGELTRIPHGITPIPPPEHTPPDPFYASSKIVGQYLGS